MAQVLRSLHIITEEQKVEQYQQAAQNTGCTFTGPKTGLIKEYFYLDEPIETEIPDGQVYIHIEGTPCSLGQFEAEMLHIES